MKQHSSHFLNLIADAKKQIHEIDAETLKTLLDSQKSFVLIDVREDKELSTGVIPSTIHLSKGIIERDIEKVIPDLDTEIVVYCSGGFRCALVALNLQAMGYHNVFSLDRGLQGWLEEGYALIPYNKSNNDF